MYIIAGDFEQSLDSNIDVMKENLGLKRWQVVAGVICKFEKYLKSKSQQNYFSVCMFLCCSLYLVHLEVLQKEKAKR